jgi:hypothetical protein
MTDEIVGSVILRHMKRSPQFLRGPAGIPAEPPLALQPGEVVVGTYQNPPPWEGCRVVFTDTAINVFEGDHLVRISWADIVDYETLDPNVKVDGVRLRTRDGIRFVRIAGAYGPEDKFKDAFNLAMVFRSLLGR